MRAAQARDAQGHALQQYAAQIQLSDTASAKRALARLRWLTLSIGAVWGAIILAFITFLRRQGLLEAPAGGAGSSSKDSKSTV
jgi:hypothetical protein